jgi:ribosomal protein S18 acetylase RimI-like enzyme
MLHWRDDVGYLESAGTLSAYRGRGLQQALIRCRIADAMEQGCRLIIGGADFANPSLTNQMACGLAVAYTAARWVQRPEAMLAVEPPA